LNSILISLTGLIVYLGEGIFIDCNYKDNKYKRFIKKIGFMSIILTAIIILIAKIFKFNDIQYLISGLVIIVFQIGSVMMKLKIEKSCLIKKVKNIKKFLSI
jgi:hypothetical protein